jgi:Leucine-rich repeat (LRR) protein
MTNDLYFIDEAENEMGLALVLKAPWSDDFIDVISKENISVLRLSHSAGWKEKDISFLEKLQDAGLRGVEVYAWDVKDITPLQFIPGLEYLGLQCKFTKAPDFSSFDQLKICKLLWRPKAKTVFGCSGLKLLNVVNYPDEDLKNLKNMIGLRRLQITSRKLVSLAGIESLKGLRILDLAECPKVESLVGVGNCQELQVVELENCKKVNDVSSLGELANLRDVVLTDCGKIKSLQPLAKCRFLESLTFAGDTNVEDGELTPLLDIPELKKMWFVDKRHYTHNRDQVAAMLS